MADDFEDLYDDSDELDDDLDDEVIEAYCMSCRSKVEMENPTPIWTRRGTPGTRGTCSVCGTTVFLMGRTEAHDRLKRPEPIQIAEGGRKVKIAPNVVYINYGIADEEFAEILSEDLRRIGISTWLAGSDVEDVQWATGVHPALVECKSMIVVLTALGIKATNVQDALKFFLQTGKQVVVAQLQDAEIPDSLRRKPRFDFRGDDYKRQFREMAAVLSS